MKLKKSRSALIIERKAERQADMSEVHDVIVVGAGAVGCAVARELARYDIKVLVLEK